MNSYKIWPKKSLVVLRGTYESILEKMTKFMFIVLKIFKMLSGICGGKSVIDMIYVHKNKEA